jgi:outer membrane protein OmpA-like peptidoglycan-associated protein
MTRQTATPTQQQTPTTSPLLRGGILQRKCESCGQHTIAGGECVGCGKQKSGLQRKLTIGASNDPLELEADRIADQVMAAPAHTAVSSTPPRIQRFTGQTDGQANIAAPASIDHVLSSPGRPLDPALQQDMGQRFGHDFSRVRVHTDAAAERSAREVNANAYTVENNIVFGAGRYAPETHEGRRLVAHELTHVVQQSVPRGKHLTHSIKNNGLTHVSDPTIGTSGLLLQRQSIGNNPGSKDDEATLLWESFRQSVTLDNFDSDKATLKPEHLSKLKDYKERFQILLGRYPDSFISVIGHTDATDTEEHNKILGQERADVVKSELTSGDSALPTDIIHSGSLGESSVAVETKGREAQNRRVEIIPRLRRFVKLPVPEASKPLPGLFSTGPEKPKEPGIGTGPLLPGGTTKIPDLKIPQRNWVEDALKKDPIIKSLPNWARDKIIDALKDGDEMLAEKIIDSLPLDGKTQAAVQAVVKSILQIAKGKKFEVPIPPLHDMPPSTAPQFPKAPGEVIIPGPTFKF